MSYRAVETNRFVDWRKLGAPAEIPRYREIARLISDLAPADVDLLDVGCGAGLLREHLPDTITYVGVEPCREACLSARAIPREKMVIERHSAESFPTAERKWGCVVLSEVLYYCRDPRGVLEKYGNAVASGGVLIVSIFQKQDPLSHRMRNMANGWSSNTQCTRIVERYMQQGCLFDGRIARIGATPLHYWRIWAGVKENLA